MEQRLVPQHNIPLELIAMKGVRGKGLLRKLALPLMLLRCVQAAKAVIRKHHIDAVIGFGGFVTFPGGSPPSSWACRFLCTSKTPWRAWQTNGLPNGQRACCMPSPKPSHNTPMA